MKKGQALVEILVAMGIAAIILPAVFTGFITSSEGKVQAEARFDATNLLREAGEALRVVREAGWSNIATNGVYHPVISGNTWALSAGAETVGELTRSIEISDIDPTDPSIKKITITVSWDSLFQSSAVETYYLTRYLDNTLYTETTVADFTAGTRLGTTITNIAGGEVQLASGGKADWCAPSLSIAAIDLPKSGVANGVTAIEGQVFAGTGDNSSGVSFANVEITNTDPPTGAVEATFDGYKTNGVFGEANYAYLATDNNSKEIVIMDLNNIVDGKYQEAGVFNSPGNGNGSSVFATTDYGYMTASSGNKLYNFRKIGSGAAVDADGVTLDGNGARVVVVGSYAYVAIGATSNQLNIVDISDPANLIVMGRVTVDGLAGRDLYVNSDGTRTYLVTADSNTQREFFIINSSDKENPSVVGSFDSAGMSPKGVTIVPGNKAIMVGTGGTQQYQVIDITNENNPVQCTSGGRSGGIAVETGVNGISSVLESDGDAYSYIITGDASSELKIIEGGPGGKFSTEGTFESQTFDAGSNTSFNRYFTTFESPSAASIKFQFAGSPGPCESATFSFTGPDKTGSTFYTTETGSLAFSGQCFRYKAFLSSTDVNQTPVFEDMTVNYSP